MRILPYGDRALLLDVDDAGAVQALVGALEHARGDAEEGSPFGEIVEVVPAARTVLLRHPRPALLAEALSQRPQLADAAWATIHPSASTSVVEIATVYDGPDLEAVAAHLGIGVEEVVRRHTAGDYVVAFLGFAPGFAYLTGGDPSLRVPRLRTPRARVPAGSVAIAGDYSAIYPTASPGGWHLLGRTGAVVWDLAAEPPTPFAPGVPVRFVAVAPDRLRTGAR